MAAVYITVPNNTPSTIDAFETRGLKTHAPCQAENSGIIVVSEQLRPLKYDAFIANIHLYAAASLFGRHSVTLDPYMNLFQHIAAEPPVAMPQATFFFKGTTEGDKDRLRSYGLGESTQSKGGVFTGRPTYTQLKQIISETDDMDVRTPAGQISGAGALAFHYAWKAIRVFCTLSEDTRAGRYAGMQFIVSSGTEFDKESPNAEKRKIESMNLMTGGHGNKVPRVEKGGNCAEGSKILAGGLVPVIVPMSRGVSFDSPFDGYDTIPKVRSGYVFPFFPEMLEGSKDSAASVFFRVFGKCYGNTAETTAAVTVALRRGFRNLAFTTAGKEIQHIFFGILAAVETGARFNILLSNGIYKGFTLISNSIRVMLRNTYLPLPSPEEFTRAVKDLDSHRRAIVALFEILGQFKGVDDAIATDYSVEEIVKYTPRRIAREIFARDISEADPEVIKKIESCINDMTFSQKYYDITPENISKLVDVLIRGGIGWPEDAPFYLRDKVAMSLSPFVRALAVFGPRAPSLVGGAVQKMIGPQGKPDQNLLINATTGKRNLPYIPVYTRSILAAASDWANVKNSRRISFRQARKGKKEMTFGQDLSIGGDAMLPLYAKLQVFCRSANEEAPEVDPREGKGKRKATDMEVDEVKQKKAKRSDFLASL